MTSMSIFSCMFVGKERVCGEVWICATTLWWQCSRD